MKNIFAIVFPLAAIAIGVYCCIAAGNPNLQFNWKGSGKRVPPLSRLGFGLFFGGIGLAIVCQQFFPHSKLRRLPLIITIVAIVGWILVAIGAALDERQRSQSSFLLPGEPRRRTSQENQAWLFVVFAVFFLGIILYMMLSHT